MPPPTPPDVSVLIATLDRPVLLRECVESVRASLAGSGYRHEVVVAVSGRHDRALSWLRAQSDCRVVLGGLGGAIPAFNVAAAKAHPGARYLCQLNDDLLVVGDSLARALRHLDAEPDLDLVAFSFTLDGGVTWRGASLQHGFPHPNQMVCRRAVEQAVAAQIGAFWGDEQHRTHPTYGGDTAFGMWASRLGFRGERRPDVRCVDRLAETTQAQREHGRQGIREHDREFAYRYPPHFDQPAGRKGEMDAAPRRAAGTAGIDTARTAPLMERFALARALPERRTDFRAFVEAFVAAHPYDRWFAAWRRNQGTFLGTLCWGADRDFGDGLVVRGAMDDRHLTNLERVWRPGGLDPAEHVAGKRCCVVGCWCGEENLLLRALGAATVDGVEEVPEYAGAARLQLEAFDVPGTVRAVSLYEASLLRACAGWYDLLYVPGVLYHLTDPVVALVIFWGLLAPGGVLAFETVTSPVQGSTARYLGARTAGWNWWSPSPDCYLDMMRDCGFTDCRQVDQVPGRAWFMGRRADRLPALETGAAGFSRPDLLEQLRARDGG